MAGEPGDRDAAFESALFDDEDPVGGNLKEKVAEAWRDFARQLVDGLRDLAPGTTLDLTLDPTASGTGDAVYSVQVSGEDGDELAATAVSNADLPAAYRLDRTVIAEIVALGWAPPGVVAGSGESFGLRVGKNEAPQLSRLITRTLRDIYGTPHPAFLTYLAHDAEGLVAQLPALGVARSLASVADANGDGVIDVVRAAGSLAELAEATDDLPLYDKVT